MESRKKFSVNINNCRHELPLLKELIQANNWEVRNKLYNL
jgi:hypothetical protein